MKDTLVNGTVHYIIIKDGEVILGDSIETRKTLEEQRLKEIDTNEPTPYEGFLIYILWDNLKIKDRIVLGLAEQQQIYVSNHHRQKGIATKLFDIFEQKALESGRIKLMSRVFFEDNDPNPFKKLLEGRGYMACYLEHPIPYLESSGMPMYYKVITL